MIDIMATLVGDTVRRARTRQWSIEDLCWDQLRPELLSVQDCSVVRFITLIEDHIPSYLSYFLGAFPTTGDLDVEEFCFNREYFRFLVSWAYDEEQHASVLTRYQLEAQVSSADALTAELAREGRAPFTLPYEQPIQAFAYTLIQEKATQQFYQQFRGRITEPVLRDLLERLARDEARHFAFYRQLITAYVQRHGLCATVPDLKDVLATFRMPLADTMGGYWRWSLRIADHVGYDHTQAYEALSRIVSTFAATPGDANAADLMTLVDRLRAVG